MSLDERGKVDIPWEELIWLNMKYQPTVEVYVWRILQLKS